MTWGSWPQTRLVQVNQMGGRISSQRKSHGWHVKEQQHKESGKADICSDLLSKHNSDISFPPGHFYKMDKNTALSSSPTISKTAFLEEVCQLPAQGGRCCTPRPKATGAMLSHCLLTCHPPTSAPYPASITHPTHSSPGAQQVVRLPVFSTEESYVPR